MRKVRVRFAPSPTGPLHIGGVRTALFNYLFARKNNGDFLLRIEDTDQKRYVKGAEQYIIESLKWLGLEPDESVEKEGKYGPYRQSERKDLYAGYAQKLVDNNWAYYAFDTPQELEAMRTRLQEQKSAIQQYNAITRGEMKNSLNLSKEETKKRIESGENYVIRFKMPENEEIIVEDIIRGVVRVNSSLLDDKVLFKSDGMPTYHLANIVDDYLMKISHVIRGEEWLPSLPLHVMLYRAFGWEEEMPEFAHLPLILKPVGKGKLSKRDGDKLGFPVFPLEWKDPQSGEISTGYRESGYFPDAVNNILALLGWNPGNDEEILDMAQLIELFELNKVGKSGSRFDPEKAHWFNQQYLRAKSDAELAELLKPTLKEHKVEAKSELVEKVVGLVKERATFLTDLWAQADFFFVRPTEYDAKTVKKRWKQASPQIIGEIADLIKDVSEFKSVVLEEKVKAYIAEKELGMGAVMNAFRLAIVGAGKGPHLFDILEIIGKDETLARMEQAVATIKK